SEIRMAKSEGNPKDEARSEANFAKKYCLPIRISGLFRDSGFVIRIYFQSGRISFRSWEMIWSVVLPSASAWKERIRRWRRTKGARAVTSSQATLKRPWQAARARPARIKY